MQIVRPKMTKANYLALKKYILREREKKKQEQEQDKEQERLKKEREMKKKKEEEDNLTLEQTKEQIVVWEDKLAALKQEKHELFCQLKKVLHQENARQKTQMKEQQNEQASFQQQYLAGMSSNAQSFLQHQSNKKYLSIPMQQNNPQSQNLKKSRSPSPSTNSYQSHFNANLLPSNSAYSNIKTEPFCIKPGAYQSNQNPSSHPGYANQHNFIQQQSGQQPPSSFQQPSNQKFSLPPSPAFYPSSHFPHQSNKPSIPDSQFPSANYLRQPGNNQRRHQPSLTSNTPYTLSMTSQMEHPSNKSGFSEDKQLKMSQRSLGQPKSLSYNQQRY